jgi:hypothetical protein
MVLSLRQKWVSKKIEISMLQILILTILDASSLV